MQERKREAVVIEQQRRIQEAITAKTNTPEDSMELKAMKAMGAMEEGDAVFGAGAEVTLDSQVQAHSYLQRFRILHVDGAEVVHALPFAKDMHLFYLLTRD